MVYCGYWYWIPLSLFQPAFSLLLRNVLAVTMPVLIPNHQHDTLIPSPCLKGSYSLSAFEKLMPQENKTGKHPLWWTLSQQATKPSYCWFYFHGIGNIDLLKLLLSSILLYNLSHKNINFIVWYILWAKKNKQGASHNGVGKFDGSSVSALQTYQCLQL